MNSQISLVVICVEVIIYLLLYNLHDRTFNQKHSVGWLLLEMFVDLFIVRYIINKNHSNTFLLINLQKTKTCSN